MNGALLSLLGAASIAFTGIFLRRAVLSVSDAAIGVFVTSFLAVPFFVLVLLGLGQLSEVAAFSWRSYLFLAAAGVVHFILGRSLHYICIQILGANIGSLFIAVSPVVSGSMGILILHEPLTWKLVAGTLLTVFGVAVVVWGQAMPQRSTSLAKGGTALKGILYGIIAGTFWGMSPILIKFGLSEGTSPIAGTFVSYAGASAMLLSLLSGREKRGALRHLSKATVGWFCVAGILSAIGHLLRYMALSLSPVTIVTPLFSTSPILVIPLSFMLNRNVEVFSARLVLGAVCVVLGVFLLF